MFNIIIFIHIYAAFHAEGLNSVSKKSLFFMLRKKYMYIFKKSMYNVVTLSEKKNAKKCILPLI